ncbi:MAG: hypothetical protein PHD36_01155 [Desulfotomaculaceae bacterium]|nr:hypothetical protein [Desulfotomaculaceae bacterium]
MSIGMSEIILLLLIILLPIILLVKRSSFSLRQNIQFWLTAGYILLLLVSPVFVKMLPIENLADMKMKTVSEKDLVNKRDLFAQAREGRPEQAEGASMLEQWEFPFNGSLINVELPERGVGAIVAERKDRADGKIEGFSYATNTIVELIDFSEVMKPHRVTLEGNVLKVDAPEQLKLEVGAFSREFVVSQILGKPTMSDHHSRSAAGAPLLYLRIPANVEVQSKNPKNPITFVE